MKKATAMIISFMLVISSFFMMLDQNVDGKDILPSTMFTGGTGTASDPFQITTLVDLQTIKMNLSANYTLINDINASATAGWGSGGWEPLGDTIGAFNGTLDGAGHTVSYITIDRSGSDYQGFFGMTSNVATIKNIFLTEISVNGDQYTGGLAGRSSASLSNCHVQGTVNGGTYTGGLAGHGSNSIDNCSTNVSTISSSNSAGGLLGQGSGLDMNSCYAIGSVQSNFYRIGGAIGYLSSGLAMNSYAIGDLSVSDEQCGGFVGTNSATIRQCYATGDISSSYSWNGGFCGRNYGNIKDCYATGNVTADRASGFCSDNTGTINCSYSIGTPSGVDAAGFVWNTVGTVLNSFWDTGASGVATSPEGLPKNTPEMMTSSTFTNSFWDFDNVWAMKDGETRPYLQGLHEEF